MTDQREQRDELIEAATDAARLLRTLLHREGAKADSPGTRTLSHLEAVLAVQPVIDHIPNDLMRIEVPASGAGAVLLWGNHEAGIYMDGARLSRTYAPDPLLRQLMAARLRYLADDIETTYGDRTD